MSSITLRNVPDPVFKALSKEAERQQRSLEDQVLFWLEKACSIQVPCADSTQDRIEVELREIRRLRGNAEPLTAQEIASAKEDGRA